MTKALIGAGCFWGIQEYFRNINGVLNTEVGYSGGHTINPSYEEVCSGKTDHAEVVNIDFDETILTYAQIINHFWICHDPTQHNKQGMDVGSQYRSVIFYSSAEQKDTALISKKLKQQSLKNLIATEILSENIFYLAEEYHQLYINKRR
jgi:peptide-methionine (S)-S-oxide reductase